MRIEKFIPMWAEDLTSVTTPLEAGSGYRVKLDVSIVPYGKLYDEQKVNLTIK